MATAVIVMLITSKNVQERKSTRGNSGIGKLKKDKNF